MGVNLTTPRPIFDWTDSSDNVGVISYTLTLTKNNNSSKFTSPTSTYTLGSNLALGNYTWSVVAHDVNGNSSLPANPANFVIVDPDTLPPTAPSLITPTLGVNLTTLRPVFDWTNSTDNIGVVSYTLTLIDAENKTSRFTSTVSTYTPKSDLVQSNYTWSVTAHDASGNSSPPSSLASFAIFSQAPLNKRVYLPSVLK